MKDDEALVGLIKKIVIDTIEEHETKLTEDEVKKIIKAIMPDLNVVVAKIVKKHIVEFGKFLTKFGSEE
ncbi:MAG: hypothetical protein PVG65_00675 [Candidatus Thorarchaeota archaeon]|jgi:hypothetical protein